MRSTRLQVTLAIVAAPAAVLSVAPPVDGATLTPIDQQRSTAALMVFDQCGVPISNTDAAPGFDLFDSSVQAEMNCGFGWAIVFAGQQSQIGTGSMTASGQGFLKSTGPDPGAVLTTAESFFEVTFELPSACDFALSGSISAGFTIAADGLTVVAETALTGPGKEPIVSELVDGGPGITIDQGGVLPAGTYTFLARARTTLDGLVPQNAVGDTAFDLVLQLTPITGDLDGDGAVGIVDFLALLAAWGDCPAPPAACPADLDGDGSVGILDFLLLLGNWG